MFIGVILNQHIWCNSIAVVCKFHVSDRVVHCKLRITLTDDEPESLSINPSSIQLYTGEQFSPSAVITPPGAAYGIMYWSSSNTGVASIDYATGRITAKSPGTTTISAVMNTGSANLSASCTLTVLSGSPPAKADGEYYIFNNWCCKPSMIKDGSMTDGTKVWQMNWSSSNAPSMKWKAIRLYNGYYLFRPLNSSTLAMSAYSSTVTIKNIGSSNSANDVPYHAQWRITKYSDGKVKLSPRSNTSLCMQTNRANNGAAEDIILASSTPEYAYYRLVETDDYVPTTGISIPTDIYLLKNGTYTFSPIVMPSNATFKKYGWEKQNAGIAQISDSTGNVVTGQGEGTAWVRARCLDTNITGTCMVTVREYIGELIILSTMDNDSSGSSTPAITGHSWLMFKNLSGHTLDLGHVQLSDGEEIALGTRGNKNEHIGLWYGYEQYFESSYNERISLTLYIETQAQYDSMNEYILQHDEWSLFYNCSSFASELWNIVFPDYEIDAGSINMPSEVYFSISEYDESEMNRDLGNYPILGYYDDNKFVEWKE